MSLAPKLSFIVLSYNYADMIEQTIVASLIRRCRISRSSWWTTPPQTHHAM